MALRKWGGETQVNTQVIGNQTNSAVASLPDGGFVVVWTDSDVSGDGSAASIKMQRYGANGLKAGIESMRFFSEGPLPGREELHDRR